MTLPYEPLCQKCAEDGTETLATVRWFGEDYCQDCLDSESEKAHERSLEAWYGGSGPQSDRERFDVDSFNRARR